MIEIASLKPAEPLLASSVGDPAGAADRVRAQAPESCRDALLGLLEPAGKPLATPSQPGDLSRVGRFEVAEVLSHGGRATTVRARDPQTQQDVVAKALPATDPGARAQAILAQIRLAEVAHEALASPLGLLAHAGNVWLVRPFVAGVTLEQVLARLAAEAVPPDAPTWRLAAGARGGGANVTGAKIVCRIGEHVARALDALHRAAVVHGALKEANVVVDETVKPTVLDAGWGRSQLPYDAPELLKPGGGARTEASDLYALGAVLYRCLTRVPVFDGDDAAVASATLRERPARPSKHNFKAGKPMEVITLALLEKDARKRFASARELADDLDRYHRNEPIQRKPSSLLARLFG